MKEKWNRYIKLYEDFKEKSVPEIIKRISTIVRKDIQTNENNSYSKTYSIDAFNFLLKINFKKGSKQPYYSNVNIYDVISDKQPINILINVVDDTIDINYLMSVVSHELRHIYDIYTICDDIEKQYFIKTLITKKYKGVNSFVDLVYLSLEHELIARHNMLYELYRWIEITDKEKLYEIFKKSYTYKALIKLQHFNAADFISKTNNLNNFTIDFSNDIGDVFDGNLSDYYQKWEKFFKKKSNEFMDYVDSMLDEVILDIKENRIYERLCGYISYNEDIGMNTYDKLFKNMIENK
jgi:uncharacterized ubiquitin-like protein YukD